MKILILGAKGMLGSDLAYVFKDLKPICWDRKEIDITKKEEVEKKIKKLKPEIVINAAAYTDVEKAEKEFSLAKKINALAVKYLVKTCAEIGAVFVHYSTDYVFDGKKKKGYREIDIPQNPINKYGLSKFLGEQEILELPAKGGSASGGKSLICCCEATPRSVNLKSYLIRTSWLFGSFTEPTKHKNFVNTILRLTKEKDELKVINDQFGKPTYTLDLAKATRKILAASMKSRRASPKWREEKLPFGIYHLTNEGVTNWYNFAKEIIKIKKLKTTIIPCKTSEYSTLAKRPKYSILVNTKGPKLRNWKKALKNYLYRYLIF